MCERYMDFAVNARSQLAVAPKDVKTLECLRPLSEPAMGERYAKAVDKEKSEWTSLISASSSRDCEPPSREENLGDGEHRPDENEKKTKKKKKRVKKNPPPAPPVNDTVMEIEDTVKEGVDWSSDEEK